MLDSQRTLAPPLQRIVLQGVGFDPLQEHDVVQRVLSALSSRQGGQIITPNVDILRRVVLEPESRHHVESATLVVADGKPLVWASRIAGTPLPARVPGSDLIWSLSGAMARENRSVYLLGGPPGTASRASDMLRERFPELRIAGHLSPPFGFESAGERYDEMCDEVVAAQPDLIFVGLGFPKQERVIARLRPRLAATWFMGCGAAIGFVAGVHQRAPIWMQNAGLEWVHRLVAEPQRLMRRYLVHDLPFAAGLLGGSLRERSRRSDRPQPTSRIPRRRGPAADELVLEPAGEPG
ncbi:MAG TPA: WecB/TagA/CpsF family glycosyltransferase [Jiangellales bacterium]|nr:WecB/TagA/CpsF family glycosyltransferase [Jiangellales bacterium]